MYGDPIVVETRKLRDEFAARFDYDLNAICCLLQEQQRTGHRQVVKRAPSPPDRMRIDAPVTDIG